MPNPENLVSLADRTPEERFAIQSAGGKKAAETKAKRKAFREELIEALAAVDEAEKHGRTAQTIGITAIMAQYKRGNLKAFELIRDTVGEKPIERMVIADVDAETIADVERLVEGIDEE